MEIDRAGHGCTGEGIKTKVKVKGSPMDGFLFWIKRLVSDYLAWLGNLRLMEVSDGSTYGVTGYTGSDVVYQRSRTSGIELAVYQENSGMISNRFLLLFSLISKVDFLEQTPSDLSIQTQWNVT
jgi:hypothetical protein